MNTHRLQFVRHVVLTGGGVQPADLLQETLKSFERDRPEIARSVRIDLVRRMTSVEIARLHLTPETAIWLEVRGSAQRDAEEKP
jgi:hypothetical protein